MRRKPEMGRDDTSGGKMHQHRGKFTEGLIDNELILKALNIKPGQTILDAGCGNGYMSKVFSKEVAKSGKVYALDQDKYFIKILKNATQGTNIETIDGDITRPTQIDESCVDLIYLSTVIHAFSQQQMQGFLREAQRLLKPDALLAIVEIEKKETPFGPPLELRYSPEELKEIVPLVPLNTVQVGEHFYMQIFQNMGERSVTTFDTGNP
jgi:ubiquinone/menaquinone biosynthesis C-methylase UbiE